MGLGKTAMFIAHCLHRDAAFIRQGSGEGGTGAAKRKSARSTGAPVHVACLCESEQPSKVNAMALASDLARRSSSAVSASSAFSGESLSKGLELFMPGATEPATPVAARQQAKAQRSAAQALTIACACCGDEHHAACVGADALFEASPWTCIRCENNDYMKQHQASVVAVVSSAKSSAESSSATQKAVNEGTGFVSGGNAVVRVALLYKMSVYTVR